ncbi:hypothetical protein KFE25_004797 [Diacronema lutheri]|uniref:SRCR domain-containing protein n=1 Tax=Diacronema lutheri TaxID=2081491 RepID=A0A8J5X819_DIALT|nr:hypothetical protein KFE25_004797 [Diacronema lutheri]
MPQLTALMSALLLGSARTTPAERRAEASANRAASAAPTGALGRSSGGGGDPSATPWTAPTPTQLFSDAPLGGEPPAAPGAPPPPALPPPSPAPVRCAPPVDGDVSLTSYPSGTMLFYKDGRWGTVCRHYTQDTLESAHVLCRQLGYEAAIEQRISEEDTSTLPINLWAVECRAGRGRALTAARGHARASGGEDGSASVDAPTSPTRVPRLADCHSHVCKHIHCGCTPADALAVTCGGAYVPDYPACGSAGALLEPAADGGAIGAALAEAQAAAQPTRPAHGPQHTNLGRRTASAPSAPLLAIGALGVVGAAVLAVGGIARPAARLVAYAGGAADQLA